MWPSKSSTDWDGKSLVDPGKVYLDNCLDAALSLADQMDSVAAFRQLARFIPPSPNCSLYTPTIELQDWDRDGVEEILLHSQIYVTGLPPCFNRTGGASILYNQEDKTGQWQGTLIWPTYLGIISRPEPEVHILDIPGAPEQPFLLVAGEVAGGDYAGIDLTIWRWSGNTLEEALSILLHDWCGYSNWDQWAIDQEGYVVLPASEATARCEARKAVRYVWKDGEFVEENPW